MLDYQERESDDDTVRWIDRIVPDGNWSGNLFDFYRKVSAKLPQDLKIPFKLKNGERQDDTPIHKAIREALVNSLVHADYSDRASVKIVKYPNHFYFRNPGLMRVPIEISLQGGESDCRNRNLHKMFRFINAGEQAGSGIPQILAGWRACHWQLPSLYEKREPNYQTVLELSMNDLLPNDVMQYLESEYGKTFLALNTDEQAILATIYLENEANHQRLKTLLPNHPADITKMLQHLVRQGMLVSTGGRWAVYSLANEHSMTGSENSLASSDLTAGHNEPSYPNKNLSTSINKTNTSNNEAEPTNNVKTTIIPKQADKETITQVILNLCLHHSLSTKQIAQSLERSVQDIRNRFISQLLQDGLLAYTYPDNPNHRNQSYSTTEKGKSELENLKGF